MSTSAHVYNKVVLYYLGFLGGSVVKKKYTCQCRKCGFSPGIGKIHCRKKRQPTLLFLPEKSYGQRTLAGDSPWGCKRVRHNLVTKQNCLVVSSQHIEHYVVLNIKHCLQHLVDTSCLFELTFHCRTIFSGP